MLKQVQDLGISTKAGQDKFLSAKAGLLSHLKNEEQQFYPALIKAAENSESLRGILDIFTQEMTKVSGQVLEFFEKYAQGGSGLEFAKDFGNITALLSMRIRREENILFAEYDKLSL